MVLGLHANAVDVVEERVDVIKVCVDTQLLTRSGSDELRGSESLPVPVHLFTLPVEDCFEVLRADMLVHIYVFFDRFV